MGRDFKERENYRNDAIVIHRIIGGVEKDKLNTPQWRAEVLAHLQAAMRLMLDPAVSEVKKAG